MMDIIQGSDEWFAIRCGKLTASRMADAVAKTKTGWGASRANLMAELIAERLTGSKAHRFVSAEMEWGTNNEADARAAYELARDCDVEQVGFVAHPLLSDSGASPDGLVGERGLIEVKCPNTATHIDTLLGQEIAGKYVTQMQWQMACAGRDWCDFVSFDPRLPASMQLYIKRVERDEKRIAELFDAASDFLNELAGKVSALSAMYLKDAA